MILLLDIGNHTLHFGLARGRRIIWHQDLPAQARGFRLEHAAAIKKAGGIEGAVIASVVPAFTGAFAALSRNQFGVEPLVVDARTDTGLRLHYHPRSSLGADRIANAAAAWHLYHRDAIVVDLGTATSIEVVTRPGVFRGGAIMPGLETMLAALKLGTAQLPKADPRVPRRAIGASTESGIRSGVFHAHFAGINQLVALAQQEVGRKCLVIATGGLSRRFGRYIRNVSSINPLLTLQGLSIIFDLHNTARRNNGR
jgi:type III pantothenate kinase